MKLNKDLLRRARRSPAAKDLDDDERIAINLLWRKGVRAVALAKIFQRSKNTIYYQCLTGEGASYPFKNKAAEINDIIEKMGEKAAWDLYVRDRPGLIEAVNAANEDIVEAHRSRDAA
jgi:hypothetical protein